MVRQPNLHMVVVIVNGTTDQQRQIVSSTTKSSIITVVGSTRTIHPGPMCQMVGGSTRQTMQQEGLVRRRKYYNFIGNRWYDYHDDGLSSATRSS